MNIIIKEILKCLGILDYTEEEQKEIEEYNKDYYRDRYIVDNRYKFPDEVECFKKQFSYPNHHIYLYKDNIRIEVCNINCTTIDWYVDNDNIKNDIKYIIEKEIVRINELETIRKQKEMELINNYEPINKE